MTFVHGPDGVTFPDDKPAKLRFFLGYVDEAVPTADDVIQVMCIFVFLLFEEVRCASNIKREFESLHIAIIPRPPLRTASRTCVLSSLLNVDLIPWSSRSIFRADLLLPRKTLSLSVRARSRLCTHQQPTRRRDAFLRGHETFQVAFWFGSFSTRSVALRCGRKISTAGA